MTAVNAAGQQLAAATAGQDRAEPAIKGTDTTAREVAAVLATVARLADGNCASKDDVKLSGGDARTRTVRLGMKIALSWAFSSKPYAGHHAIEGSQRCGSSTDAQRHLERVCGTACRDAATSKRVADALGKSGLAALDSYTDSCDLGALPHRAHHEESCSGCSGHGIVRCPDLRCIRGKRSCLMCGQTGLLTCSACVGSGYISDNGRYHTCGTCAGRGRRDNCLSCLGSGFETCQRCDGSGEVGCDPCSGTGYYTRVYSTQLQGKVSRSLGFDADAPDGFKRSCEAVTPTRVLAQSVGSLVRAEASSAAGEATLMLHCQVRHVHVEMTCKLERIHVDALGPSQSVPLMPSFLDGLTCELGDDIGRAARRNPTEALALAMKSRLTRSVLSAVGQGSRSSTSALVRRWSGAASEYYLDRVVASLGTAYALAGRSSVRRTWLLLSPLMVVGALLLNAYQVPSWLLNHVHLAVRPSLATEVLAVSLAEFVAVLPIVLLAWAVAGQAGRRRLRSGLGALARRSPRQGPWPALGLLLAVAAGWAGAAMQLDASPMGLPWAPVARPGGQSLAQALAGGTASAPDDPKPLVETHPHAPRPQLRPGP